MTSRARRSLLLLLAGLPSLARAEGAATLGGTLELHPATGLHLDVLDPDREIFVFTGEEGDGGDASVLVIAPDGSELGTFLSGQTITPPEAGTYTLRLTADDALPEWDVTVWVDGEEAPGRLSATTWTFAGGGFTRVGSLSGSFYLEVPGGDGVETGVIELRYAGLAGGALFQVLGNGVGVPGAGGSGVPLGEAPVDEVPADVPVYLSPPEVATYTTLSPTVADVALVAGERGCEEVSPGEIEGALAFTSDLDATWHLTCDLDGDGTFDPSTDADLHLIGEAAAGLNTVPLDGLDNTGAAIPPGAYSCELWLAVGEFHYLAVDIESAYPGLRLFEVGADGSRTGLDMYWDDSALTATDVPMIDGQASLASSGPEGLWAGGDEDGPVVNENSRGWGDFTEYSKGDFAWLDTWTWLGRSETAAFTLTVADSLTDTDSDGLSDTEERCTTGTDPEVPDTDTDGLSDWFEHTRLPSDPLDPDSDDDGVRDGDEVAGGGTLRDTDGDGDGDLLDPDDDGDGIPTATELDGAEDPSSVDHDGDSVPDHLDTDDDGDGVDTAYEDRDRDGDWTDDDNDGDGIADWLDPDDDGDGMSPEEEDLDGNGAPFNDDLDRDGIPDWLDDDDDGDGIPSTWEDRNDDEDLDNDDRDGDGTPDWHDPDDDGDGVPTAAEDQDRDGNPRNDDTDQDGLPDCWDEDDDGDGVATADEDRDGDGFWSDDDSDRDGVPDPYDADDDDDGLDGLAEDVDGDGDPTDDDTDGDGTPDLLDADDDDDGLPTAEEDADGDGDWSDDDADGDGVPDYREEDDDDDGILTRGEDLDRDGDPRDDDSDDDGTPDYLDDDDDNDGVPTRDEDTDGDGDWSDDDLDSDRVPDYLDPVDDRFDPDSDDDTVFDIDEDADGDGDLEDDDSDGDGTADWLDDDDDDDGIPTAGEDPDGDGDPTDDDADEDGVPDFRELDDDGDGILTPDEDPDGDGDPRDDDSDDDGRADYRDDDDDGDGVPTAAEDLDGDGDWTDDDSDGDGVPEYLDPDPTPEDTGDSGGDDTGPGETGTSGGGSYYQGGGCVTAPGGAGLGLGLTGLLLLAARRRPSTARAQARGAGDTQPLGVWVGGLLLLLGPGAGSARAADGADAHGFAAAPPDDAAAAPLRVLAALGGEPGSFSVQVLGERAERPLERVAVDADGQVLGVEAALDDLWALDLGASFWAHRRLRLDLAAPVYVGSRAVRDGEVAANGAAFGDLHLGVTIGLVEAMERRPVGLVLRTWAGLPTGDPERWLGAAGASGGADLAATGAVGSTVVSAQLGLRGAPGAPEDEVDGGLGLVTAAALGHTWVPGFGTSLEIHRSSTLRPAAHPGTGSPTEVYLSARWTSPPGLQVLGGGGLGLGGGVGTAAWRLFLGVGVSG